MSIGPRRQANPAANLYEARPVPRYVTWLFIALAAALFVFGFNVHAHFHPPLVLYKFKIGSVMLGTIFCLWMVFRSVSLRVEIVKTELHVYGDIFWKRVSADAIDVANARILDLSRENELGWRLFGVALPGYLTGLFTRRGGGLAWVLVTDRRSVLRLPLKEGPTLFVSLKDNEGLLARLQKYASRPASGGEN